MVEKLKRMSGKEFVRKILEGERDFRGIGLYEGSNLSADEKFVEMQIYLQEQDLEVYPVTIEGSIFFYVKAIGLHFPYVKGNKADLRGADLAGAYLKRADLRGADLRGADFEGAYLEGADLKGADLGRAYLERAYLWRADLRGVRNLSEASCLRDAVFRETIVTPAEKEIIERALNMFVVKR